MLAMLTDEWMCHVANNQFYFSCTGHNTNGFNKDCCYCCSKTRWLELLVLTPAILKMYDYSFNESDDSGLLVLMVVGPRLTWCGNVPSCSADDSDVTFVVS